MAKNEVNQKNNENYSCDSSSERIVVSISRLKSSSLRLALAVNKSRKVSNGENFSSSFGRPKKLNEFSVFFSKLTLTIYNK